MQRYHIVYRVDVNNPHGEPQIDYVEPLDIFKGVANVSLRPCWNDCRKLAGTAIVNADSEEEARTFIVGWAGGK
jgi:hypothetical protein